MTAIAIVTMMPSATTQPEKKRKTALASVQGDQHHFFQMKYQLYLYHPSHILNCWLWLCNFQAQFWCWRSSRIDYHNYLTIWPCQIFRLSQLSDALCEIYRLTREQQFDSTLSKHLTDTWYFGCMVFCHIYDKCWFQPFNAIGRIIWRSQLQQK